MSHVALALLVFAVLAVAVAAWHTRVSRTAPASKGAPPPTKGSPDAVALHEIRGDNPCLAVRAKLGAHDTVFCIDTGFAGPCLLSMPTLALERSAPAPSRDVGGWCDHLQAQLLRKRTSARQREEALQDFLARTKGSDFTAGCTMRLASIGATEEQTSEILLTPPLELQTVGGGWTSPRAQGGQPVAEILTSTPMATMHLLTCDWLVQNGPSLLCPHEGVLRTHLTPAELAAERASMRRISSELRGGSFVAVVHVDGVPLRVTVDTGAACYLSVGAQAARKLSKSCRATGRTMRQVGANGERICSHAVLCSVSLGGAEGDSSVPVLVNDAEMDGEDGYVGVCLLRHYDLCVLRSELLARRNAAPFDAGMLDGVLSERDCGSKPPECVGD